MAENADLLEEVRERLALLRVELQKREAGSYRERLAIPLLQDQIMELERREAELGGFAPVPSPSPVPESWGTLEERRAQLKETIDRDPENVELIERFQELTRRQFQKQRLATLKLEIERADISDTKKREYKREANDLNRALQAAEDRDHLAMLRRTGGPAADIEVLEDRLRRGDPGPESASSYADSPYMLYPPSPQYTQMPGTPYTGPSTLRPGEHPGSPRGYEVSAPTPGTMEDDPEVTGAGDSSWEEELEGGGWGSPSGFEQVKTPTWETDEDVGGAGAASSQGWESAASSSSAQEDVPSEDFATKAEARAKAAFEATYTEIRAAFGVAENATASDWNAYLKGQVEAAVEAGDVASLTTRYTRFLTDQTLSTPLSLFEVAFIAHLNVAKTPQVGTLKIVADAIPGGTLDDFATIALVVAGYVQTSTGISKSVEEKLVKLGLATTADRVKLVISSGALRTLIRENNTAGYEIRNAALDVFRALADVKLQNGRVTKSKNARKFTGSRRLEGPVNFLIRDDDPDTTIPMGAYTGFSSSFVPTEWPYPSAPATKGKKKKRSSEQGPQKRAKKRLGEAGAALDDAADLKEYLADVLKYIRDGLGEDHEDYKRLLQRLDAYSRKHAVLEQTLASLRTTYAELQDKNEETEAQLETANASLREALASLEKALEAGDGGTGVALKTLEAAEKRAEEAEKQLEKCNKDLEDLAEQLAEAVAKIQRLKESGAKLQDELNRCKSAYASLKGAYDSSQYKLKLYQEKLGTQGLEDEIATLKKRVAELQGGQDAWKHRLLDAAISGSMVKFREAFFFLPYKYKLDEVTELLKLGTERTIFETDDRGRFLFSHPVLTGVNTRAVFDAMNEAIRRFVISDGAIRNKIVRRDIREMDLATRQAYARGLLESAGVPWNMINRRRYLDPVDTEAVKRRSDWRGLVAKAVGTGNPDDFLEALYFTSYPYTKEELTEVLKFGSAAPLFALDSANKPLNRRLALLIKIPLEDIFGALNTASQLFVAGEENVARRVVMPRLTRMTEGNRRAYVRSLFEAAGLPGNTIDAQPYLRTPIQSRIESKRIGMDTNGDSDSDLDDPDLLWMEGAPLGPDERIEPYTKQESETWVDWATRLRRVLEQDESRDNVEAALEAIDYENEGRNEFLYYKPSGKSSLALAWEYVYGTNHPKGYVWMGAKPPTRRKLSNAGAPGIQSLIEGRISAKQIKQYEPAYFTNGEVDFANLFKAARDRKYKDGAKVMAAYLASDKFSKKHLARIGILQVSESDWLKTYGTKLKRVSQIATSLLGAAILGRKWDVVKLLVKKGANERVPTTNQNTKPPVASPVLIAKWIGRSKELDDVMYKHGEFKKMLR